MPDQKNRNILVSGGAGYIGSTTVRSLKAAGYHPIVIDDFSTGHREFVAGVEYVEGNVADGTLVAATVRKYGIGAAMHFASFINVGDSVKEPAEYYLNNVSSGIAFIAALQKAGVKKFILSSTCAVYGALEKPQPLNESMPIAPLNPYAHAKRMLEIVLEDFTRAYDFHAVIFRYFNAAGAAADALLQHLSLLFVPVGVGVMTHLALISQHGLRMALALLLSTWLGLAVTAWVLQWLWPADDAAQGVVA